MRAFIWDLDGTLIDSYGVIIESLQETFLIKVGTEISRDEIEQVVLNYSVKEFITRMCEQYGLLFDEVKAFFSEINNRKILHVPMKNNAVAILSYLDSVGDQNYVYTHKGRHAKKILEHAGVLKYFKEVVTSENGFPRKPAPDGIDYLVEKYHLDVESTFYVGDRNLDMECANNANVKGILYLEDNSIVKKSGLEDYVVDDLIKIKNILTWPDTGLL